MSRQRRLSDVSLPFDDVEYNFRSIAIFCDRDTKIEPFYWQAIDSESRIGVSPSYARRRKIMIEKL